jgi:energy-converting hydrogenase A subunit F
MNDGDNVAPYDRGGEILISPGITMAQYPQYSEKIGMINSYMSPIADNLRKTSPYFGTSIYSSPGGLIDEILYYTRGFDTILESTILMMSFVIASWLALNFTMKNKDNDEEEDDEKDKEKD